MQLLERISQVAAEATAVALTAYRKLVIRSAGNDGADDIDPSEAISILQDAEKTHLDLSDDVELLQQRQRWEADIAAYDEARADWAVAEPRIAELEKLKEEAIKRVCRKFNAELEELRPKDKACLYLAGPRRHAQTKLRETTSSAAEIEQFRSTILKQAAKRQRDAKKNCTRTLDSIGDLQRKLGSAGNYTADTNDRVEIRKNIELLQTRLKERQELLATTKKELQEAQAKFDELTAASLKA